MWQYGTFILFFLMITNQPIDDTQTFMDLGCKGIEILLPMILTLTVMFKRARLSYKDPLEI